MSDDFCQLSARITPGDAKCLNYRSAHSATCRDCDLLKPKEIKDMAGQLCVVKGCEKYNVRRGFCTEHLKEHEPAVYEEYRTKKTAEARKTAASKAPAKPALSVKVTGVEKVFAALPVAEVEPPVEEVQVIPVEQDPRVDGLEFHIGKVLQYVRAWKEEQVNREMAQLSELLCSLKDGDVESMLKRLVC